MTPDDKGKISDGYHTFDELYDHRITLFISLCKHLQRSGEKEVWRSKKHSDQSEYAGWFVLGINKANGEQITYHVPLNRWEETNFAENLPAAPEWDKHTPQDVLNRIKLL